MSATTPVLIGLPAEACKFQGSNHCGFPAPTADIFDYSHSPIFTIGSWGFTKPMLLAIVSVGVVIAFFWAAFAKPKLVPRGAQNLGELGYLFVRDQISREAMGKKGDRFVPFLVAMFFFVWIMNLMSIIPVAQFPVTSRIAFPASLSLIVWLLYMGTGFKRHGFVGYIKVLCVPSGVPGWVMVILVPIEFISNVFVRPFTLAIRLFANMFAGHVILATFMAATWYLLPSVQGFAVGAVSLLMVCLMTVFEMGIQALQAYIITMLSASYLAGALEEGH